MYDLITSPYTYSGNLLEPGRLSFALTKIARIDRLPPDNTLGGLKALGFSWDTVDICNHVGSQMKTVTKVSYASLIILGIIIGGLTVVQLNMKAECPSTENRLMNETMLNIYTTVLALVSGILAGIVNIVSPAQKWTRLRGAALAIEGEIWRFRTRTGVYTENSSESDSGMEPAEQNLQNRAEFIKQQVIKSAGVLNTHFMSMFEVFDKPHYVKLYRHGQYPNCSIQGSFGKPKTFALKATPESAVKMLKGTADDFYSPCRPSDYLEFRVQPMMRFYQGRLPVYSRIKTTSQIFLLVGAFSGAVLALFNIATWAAIGTAILGGVTTWSEFHGTEDKLTRYSDAVAQTESIVLWWDMLSLVDQSNLSKINELVDRCELVFRDERQAWVSMNLEQKKTNAKNTEEASRIPSDL